MKPKYFYYKIYFLTLFIFIYNNVNSQCGIYPSNGITNVTTVNTIINSYYPGVGNAASGAVSLTVGTRDARGNSSSIAAGDLILIIQMQGADINTNNTDSYGDGVAGGSASGYLTSNLQAGNFEYNTVFSVISGATTTINLEYPLVNAYFSRAYMPATSLQTYQVIRVPRYYDLIITNTGSITAPAWNGGTGGVVVIEAANNITLNGSVHVNAKGFRGGGGKNFRGGLTGHTNGTSSLSNTDYRWNSAATTSANTTGGAKGEGIAGTPQYILEAGSTTTTTNSVEGYIGGSMGRGAPGNAGGGGTDGAPSYPSNSPWANELNTGGGGGGNGGSGGRGGNGWHNNSGNTYPYGGHGGSAFSHYSLRRVIMGGGGGAGTANQAVASDEFQSSGGIGGGIVIIRARQYAGTGSVNANGGNGTDVTLNYNGNGNWSHNDGAGGGGAGGSIILVTNNNGVTGLNTITATATGGSGGNASAYNDHGPGGGGGGGLIFSNGTLSSTNVAGGMNGRTRTGSNNGPLTNDYGATSGLNGQSVTLNNAPVLFNPDLPTATCGVLPIQLISFRGLGKVSGNYLEWIVVNSSLVQYFEVEYGTDGKVFYSIKQIQADPNIRKYDFVHNSSATGKSYYRVKVVERTNGTSFSKIVMIDNPIYAQHIIKILPSLNGTLITIQYESKNKSIVHFSLTNAQGTQLVNSKVICHKGYNEFNIQIPSPLPKGLYLLHINQGQLRLVEKLLIK